MTEGIFQVFAGQGCTPAGGLGNLPPVCLLANMPTPAPADVGMWIAVLVVLLGLYLKFGAARKEFAGDVVNAVLAKIRETSGGHTMQLDGQPIGIRHSPESVAKPEFERHTEEIWIVINGLRRDISEIKVSLAQVAAARDGNGERISQLTTEVSALGKQLSHLAGIIEAHTENHHRPK